MVNLVRKTLADGSVKEYRYERGKPKAVKTEAVTFGYALREWCKTDDYKTLKANSKEVYAHSYKMMVKAAHEIGFDLEGAPVTEFTTPRINRLLHPFSGEPGKANSAISVFSKVFTFCVSFGWMQFNPTREVIRPSLGERRPWTPEEFSRADENFSEYYRDVLWLGVLTGQRASDLVKAQWTDIEDGYLHVQQIKCKRGDKPTHVWIPISGALKEFLDSLRARTVVGATILLTMNGRRWDLRAMKSGFAAELKRICIPNTTMGGVSLHGLRHTFATMMRDNGSPDEDIISITGHKTPSVLQRYLDKFNKKKVAVRAAEVRDAAFSGMFDANRPANRRKTTPKLLKLQ